MSFTKGSEWRKWDLHVHTPKSVLNNGFGGNWDEYVKQLFKKAIKKNINAIAITDYCSIDGYKKIKKDYLSQSSKMQSLFELDEIKKIKKILIFPNIEFRLKKLIGGNAINFHVLFSEKALIEDIENNFLHELSFVYQESLDSGEDRRKLTRRNIEQLGQRLQNEHRPFQDDSNIYFTGVNNLKIDDIEITKILKSKQSIFQNKYVFILPTDEDLSQVSWNGQDHNERKLLVQKSHFLFSGNPNTSKWGLGEYNDSVEEYIQEFKSLKPTLWGSDAHNFDKLFEPDLQRYTWIKSDLTFEGLRQVLHEPSRACIQSSIPLNKNTYQYIESITLKDEGELFDEQIIGLSPDLNSIIGGKSSGKSLLLYHLAKAVMNHEKFNQIFSIDNFPKYDNLPFFELEAKWADGHISKLSGFDNKRPIVYIPQMYLNYMAEKKNKNEDFKQTINDILISNYGYKEFINNKEKEIFELEQKIDNGIREYFSNLNKLNVLQQELRQLGDKNAIEANIQVINQNLKNLRSTSGFTEEESSLYYSLNKNNKEISDHRDTLNKKKELFNSLIQKVNQIKNKIPTFLDDEFSDIKYIYQEEELKSIMSVTIQQISSKLNTSLEEYLRGNPFNATDMDNEIAIINQKIIHNNNQLQPLNEKINNLNTLKAKENELLIEQNKIKTITVKIKEIEYQRQLVNMQPVIDNYQNLFNCYCDIVDKHNEYKKISDSIDLLSEVAFNIDNFERDFSSYITKNRTLENIFDNCGFNGNGFIFNKDEHINYIQLICNTILNDNQSMISFNQSKTKEEIIRSLLKNYYDISYDLVQDNDRLGHMSPGKKGIILFQLFLHMSSSQDPILIDQPEDNLDNRTVYQELNDFIKEKKLQRQIIIVSHNSNLVVSTDSENIIVAHQNPNEISPKFEYINGSLENTFTKDEEENILKKQGIREHVCDILEGGVEAFKKRERKYNL